MRPASPTKLLNNPMSVPSSPIPPEDSRFFKKVLGARSAVFLQPSNMCGRTEPSPTEPLTKGIDTVHILHVCLQYIAGCLVCIGCVCVCVCVCTIYIVAGLGRCLLHVTGPISRRSQQPFWVVTSSCCSCCCCADARFGSRHQPAEADHPCPIPPWHGMRGNAETDSFADRCREFSIRCHDKCYSGLYDDDNDDHDADDKQSLGV